MINLFKNETRVTIVIASAIILSGIVIITMNKSMEKLFHDELEKELQKYSDSDKSLILERDIISLPSPVQKYFRFA